MFDNGIWIVSGITDQGTMGKLPLLGIFDVIGFISGNGIIHNDFKTLIIAFDERGKLYKKRLNFGCIVN